MRCISKKDGFTLAELMAVVAILGILVTISIVVFGGHTDEAEKAVCDANKAAIAQYMDMEEVNGLELIPTVADMQVKMENSLASAKESVESWHCPTGGTYEISFRDEYDPNSWYIYCSYHDGGEEVKKLINVGIDDASMNAFIEALKKNITTNVDSTANLGGVRTDNVNKIRDILTNLNIDPDSNLIKSWQYIPSKGKDVLYMSGIDITNLPNGHIFPVLKYSEEHNAYTVWLARVNKKTASGIYVGGKKEDNLTYNIISATDNQITAPMTMEEKAKFSNVKPIYDKIEALYKTSPDTFQKISLKDLQKAAGFKID